MKRSPVTKKDYPKLLAEVLNLDEQRKAKIAKVIAQLREYGEIPKGQGLDPGDSLYSSLIFTVISQDGINGANTRSIKEAYGLGDDDITYILQKTESRRDISDSSTPLLPFTNPDGTPQDLDALDALEKFDAGSIPHIRSDSQIFAIAKAAQLAHKTMSIPAGQLTVARGFNVAPRKAKDQVIVSVTWELAKSLGYEFRLNFFDMRVENACYNLYTDGMPMTTVAQIVRELDFMAGDQNVSEERCRKVFESLKRLGVLNVEVDYTAQMKQQGKAKAGDKYTIGGMAVPLRWGKIERNGTEKIAVKILAAPIFTAYSVAAGNLATISRQIMMAATTRQLDENGKYIEGTGTLSNTQIVGDYRYYMAHQLKRIANTGNNKIKYDTIFEETGDTLPMDKTTKGRVTRKNRKEVIAKLLDAWKAVGFIRSWKTTKDKKGVEDGVEITMPTPTKGLKAPEKR